MERQYENLTVVQGDTLSHTFTILESCNSVADLTGYSASMQIRLDPWSSSAVYTTDSSSSKLNIDPARGNVSIKIPDTDTSGFSWSRAFYSIKLQSPSGEITHTIFGTIEVLPPITV